MQTQRQWITGHEAWNEFTAHHPELGYKPGKWAFHNFLRYYRDELLKRDAIRRAKNRFWVAHRVRFPRAAFDLATGAAHAAGDAPHVHDLPVLLGRGAIWCDVLSGVEE